MSDVVLVVPIAFDLALSNGKVVVGPGTKKACDEAITYVRSLPSVGRETQYIFLSASKAGREYDHVVMGKVMQDYVNEVAPDIRTILSTAFEFTTLGEVWSVARYAHALERERIANSVTKVVFCVKAWHAWRVHTIAKLVFKHFTDVEQLRCSFEIIPHRLPVSNDTHMAEIVKTILTPGQVRKFIRQYCL